MLTLHLWLWRPAEVWRGQRSPGPRCLVNLMQVLSICPVVPGGSAAERLKAFLNLSDDELASWLSAFIEQQQSVAERLSHDLALQVAAPVAEVVASPFGLRAVLMAAGVGSSHAHLEHRPYVEWPESVAPDDAVSDELHQVWDAGVFHVGKYQSFLQDEPFATYNPNHMAKWTPHELLHRAAGFFWRDDASDWEYYLGARLNELAPVVLWYGLDEVARGDVRGFDRKLAAQRPWLDLSECHWLDANQAQLGDLARRSVPHLRAGLEHWSRELRAIDSEIELGRCVNTADDRLDASSDAIAYVVGHGPRLRERAIGRMIPRLLGDGRDYFTHVGAYRDHVEQLFDTLLFGSIVWNPDECRSRRARRCVWDLFQRTAQAGWPTFRPVVALLDDAANDMEILWQGGTPELADRWFARLRSRLPADTSDRILSIGVPWYPVSCTDEPVQDGIASLAPQTWSRLQSLELAETVLRKVGELAHVGGRRNLRWRLQSVVDSVADKPTSALLDLELRIASRQQPDEEVERLSMDTTSLDHDWDELLLSRSKAFDVMVTDWDVQALHADPTGQAVEGCGAVLVGFYQGGASILPAPPPIRELWMALGELSPVSANLAVDILDEIDGDSHEDWPETGDDWLVELIDAGAVGMRRVAPRQVVAPT